MIGEDDHLLLGAYVLGGLDAADRYAFELHLQDCPRCPYELAQASGLPAQLRRVGGVPGLPSAEPPLVSPLSASRARRRRGRVRLALAAAGAAVVVATGSAATTVAVTRPATGGGRVVVVAGRTGAGTVTLREKIWGTAVGVRLADLPHTGTFVLRVTDDRGRTESAAAWAATAAGTASLSGTTSFLVTQVREVSVDRPDDSVVAAAAV